MKLAAFDILLTLLMLWLAWRSITARNLFRAVVQFITLGMLMALAWIRLRAPDVALAEAAVGSGLTGALLLSALGRVLRREQARDGRGSRGASGEQPQAPAVSMTRS